MRLVAVTGTFVHLYQSATLMAFFTPRHVDARTMGAGLVLTSDAAGHSSYIFSSFAIGSSGNGVGRGGFALNNIASGARIIAEAPLISFVVPDRKKVRGAEMADQLQRALGELDDVRRAAFFALTQLPDGDFAGRTHSFEAAFAIWMTNAYPTTNGASEGGDGQAIFEQICRLNHACHPNAVVSWNHALGVQTLHAVVDIAKGAELTVAYWDDEAVGMVRSERLALASERYGFACRCATCRLTGAALATSDEQQRRAKVLTGLIDRSTERVGSSGGAEGDDAHAERRGAQRCAAQAAQDVAQQGFAQHERLCEWVATLVTLMAEASMPHPWARPALLRAAWSARHCGEWAAARAWAIDAAACARVGSGEDSVAFRAITAEHLRSFRAAGAGTWRRVSSAAFGGFDVVASRSIQAGEVRSSEAALTVTHCSTLRDSRAFFSLLPVRCVCYR